MAWYNNNWDYRVKLTIQSSKIDSDLTDFPVYIDLSDLPAGFHANVNQTDARDIRITTSDGTTELAREIVNYDSTADTGEVHFKFTGTLSSSADTDVYVYYGNSGASDYGATDTYGRNAVWDDYLLVYHLQEAVNTTTDGYIDSTGNGYNGTGVSMAVSESAAVMGNGQNFDGANDYIYETDDSNAVNVGTLSANDFTTQAYYKKDATGQGVTDIYGDYDGNYWYMVWFNNNTSLNFAVDDDTNFPRDTITVTDNTDWHKVAGRWDQSTRTAYISDNKSHGTGDSVASFTPTASTSPLYVGAGGSARTTQEFDGMTDEMRVRASLLSDDWLDAEYENQVNPDTFFSVGSQETKPTTGDIKTINSITWANVKTVNGVAEADIKTINGVSAN